jgi:hypothetical protein
VSLPVKEAKVDGKKGADDQRGREIHPPDFVEREKAGGSHDGEPMILVGRGGLTG